MTVLKILAALIVVLLVSWGLATIQSYSLRKYKFPPFNLASLTLLIIGWILFFLAIYVLPEGKSIFDSFDAIKALSFPDNISNSIALVYLSALFFLAVLVGTAIKTNPVFAVVTWVIQFLAALLIVPFLVFLIPGGKRRRKKRRKEHRPRRKRLR